MSFAISWWSLEVTSGSSIEESYSFTKSDKPSEAPDIDIMGVFKLCAIPPINWPKEARRSLSIRVSWLVLIVVLYSFVLSWTLLNAVVKSPSSSLEVTGKLCSLEILSDAAITYNCLLMVFISLLKSLLIYKTNKILKKSNMMAAIINGVINDEENT